MASLTVMYDKNPRIPMVITQAHIDKMRACISGELNWCGDEEECIRRGAKGLLKEVSLFDIYRGKGVPEGKKSAAFNLILRADDRSLTAAEADEDVSSILALLQKELGAVLR